MSAKQELKTNDEKPSVKKVETHIVPSDAYSETIELHPIDKTYQIKRTRVMYKIWKDTRTDEWEKQQILKKDVEWFPLSHWGFTKKLKTVVIVFRVMQKRDITKKEEVIYYKLPVEYSIREHVKTKNLYLKSGSRMSIQYVGRRKVVKHQFSTINVRDVKEDRSFPIHDLNQDDLPDFFPYSYLDIKLGKGKEIDSDRVEHLIQSGQVLRITDEDLKRRLVM